MLPHEVQRLEENEMLLMVEKIKKPVLALRTDYREQEHLKGRYEPNPYHERAIAKAINDNEQRLPDKPVLAG